MTYRIPTARRSSGPPAAGELFGGHLSRSRYIKPDFFDDPKLAQCTHSARLLFIATWQWADKSGVFEWDIAKLRKYVFGYEDISTKQVEIMLTELLEHGFIRFGEHESRRYGYVVNLAKHQHFHVGEKSKFETLAKSISWTSTVPARCQHGASTPLTLTLTLTDTLTDTKIPFSEPETKCHMSDVSRQSDNIQTVDSANKTSKEKNTKPKAKSIAPGVSPPGVTVEIREAWKLAFEKRYQGQQAAWGKREGGQAKNLLGTFSKAELLKLVEYFFAWKRPEVIRAGHSFGTGPNSFVMKIHELRADIADADRRKQAAQIQEREKLTDKLAVEQDGVNRINALLAQEEHDEQRRMEESKSANSGEITQGSYDADGSARQALERPGDDGLVHGAGEVRSEQSNLDRIGEILRATTAAIDIRSKITNRKQSPRVPAVQTDSELDARGAQQIFSGDEEMPF